MRTYRRLHVRLSKGDREKLDDILSAGVQAVRTVLRALVLCRLDEGRSASKVAAAVRLTAKAVREIGRRYEDGGLEQALYERPRPGAACAGSRPMRRSRFRFSARRDLPLAAMLARAWRSLGRCPPLRG